MALSLVAAGCGGGAGTMAGANTGRVVVSIDWIRDEARRAEKGVAGTQLVGVIRTRDLPTATWLKVRPEQIVDGEPGDKKL